MMHTEDEAKNKACCGPIGIINAIVLGIAESQGGSFTLALGRTDLGACIGSACMAWRPIMTCETVIGERDKKPEGDGWEWDTFSDDRWERPVPTGKGYCGLAGRPA